LRKTLPTPHMGRLNVIYRSEILTRYRFKKEKGTQGKVLLSPYSYCTC